MIDAHPGDRHVTASAILASIPELLQEVVLALAIGGLIGIERENNPERKYAGIRTLAILAGIGPVVVAMAEQASAMAFVTVYLTLAALFAIMIVYLRVHLEGENVGLTTSVTVFMVAVLGVLVGFNVYLEAISVAIITGFLLVEKESVHRYIDKLAPEEISDAMKLAILVFILLPILPASPVGPYDVINLREVLILAIFVLLIEFAAFVSMRQVGPSKGMHITALLGGVASSFATTGVLAKLSRKDGSVRKPASSAIMLTVVSMIVRNVVIAVAIIIGSGYVISQQIGRLLGYPALAMIVAAAAVAFMLRDHSDPDSIDIPMDSPFSFRSAAKFAGAFIVISIASTIAQNLFGDLGLYATAFAGGLISSVAVATSAATLISQGTIGPLISTGMILAAIIASIVAKIFLLEVVNKDIRRYATIPMAGIIAVGVVTFLIL